VRSISRPQREGAILIRYVLGTSVAVALALATLSAGASSAQATSSSRCTVYIHTPTGSYSGYVIRSVRTSCPFARAVARASLRVIVRAGGSGNGFFSTRAYSPVTHRWYRVRCAGSGNVYTRRGVTVDCRAGIGARVVYRAWH
jgi:hypothetical protein